MSIRTAKLTDIEVLALRARQTRGERIDTKVEADRYQCGVETIRKVLRGDTFRHLLRDAVVFAPEAVVPQAELEASFTRFLSELSTTAPLENPDDDIQSLLGNLGGNTPT